MGRIKFLFFILFFICNCFDGILANSQQFCSIFQPFKISPENAKYQIGGPFPLHTEDCLKVKPGVVQELIAVQWALSHWNQNAENVNSKLAMSVADTCSREKEGLSQIIGFLNEGGFFVPKECQDPDNQKYRIPLGVIMPSMETEKLKSLINVMNSIKIPVITYSTSTAQALFDANVTNAYATTPTLDNFLNVTITLLNQLKISRLSIVYSSDHLTELSLKNKLTKFSKSDIVVTDISRLSDLNPLIISSDIILILASKSQFFDFASIFREYSKNKIFIFIPLDDESVFEKSELENLEFKNNLIILQRSLIFDPNEFKLYFLDILKNNFQSYSLLASFMEQIFNCSLTAGGFNEKIDCSELNLITLSEKFQFNRAVESAVLAAYSFGALTKFLISDELSNPCLKNIQNCVLEKSNLFLKSNLNYKFTDSDPRSYQNFQLKFGENRILENLKIEGIFVKNDQSEPEIQSILNFTTSTGNLETDLAPIINSEFYADLISWCEPWRSECQKEFCDKKDKMPINRMWTPKTGQVYLMGLFDLRNADTDGKRCDNTIDDPRSILLPAAFTYTLETIRQKYPDFNLLPNLELGSILIDSCHDPISSIENVITASSSQKCFFDSDDRDNDRKLFSSKNILGYVSGQKSAEYEKVRLLFTENSKIKKHLLGISSLEKQIENTKSKISSESNFMPNLEIQAKVIFDLLLKQNWDYVSILLSDSDPESIRAFDAFEKLIETDDRICISDTISMSRFKGASPATRVTVAFTTSDDTELFLKSMTPDARDRPVLILTGDSHDWESEKLKLMNLHSVAFGALSIQPRHRATDDFRIFLSKLNPKSFPEPWFVEFWEDYFECSLKSDSKYKKLCSGDQNLPFEKFGRMTREGYFMLGLETFIFALDGLYKQLCPNQNGGLCREFFEENFDEKVSELMNRMPKIDQQFIIYNYRAENIGKGPGYVEIGNWTTSSSIRFSDTPIWYDSDGNSTSNFPESTCQLPLCRCKIDKDFFKQPIQSISSSPEVPSDQKIHLKTPTIKKSNQKQPLTAASSSMIDFSSFTIKRHEWKNQAWPYIFLVINTILLLISISILGLICVKVCFRVIKGNQSLGIFLLIGIILLYVTVYFYIFDPCELLCRLRYFFHNLAYTISFGCMLAKALQLRNSETIGFNGYISYWNYWLLLFFILTVQLAINFQWILLRDSVQISFLFESDGKESIQFHCSWSSEEFLTTQIYPIILLSLTLIISLMNRNIKRNYKETQWLIYTCLISVPIWIIWMISYSVIKQEQIQDSVIIMELITCASVILCFMFGPKLYILFSYEPILIEYPPGFKFFDKNQPDNGIGIGNGPSQFQAPPQPQNDLGILNFIENDDDILTEDGRRSAATTKSTMLTHTASSASSMTTSSEDSSSMAPVYRTGLRKKSKNKKMKFIDPIGSNTTIESASTITDMTNPTMSPELDERKEIVFDEIISSVH